MSRFSKFYTGLCTSLLILVDLFKDSKSSEKTLIIYSDKKKMNEIDVISICRKKLVANFQWTFFLAIFIHSVKVYFSVAYYRLIENVMNNRCIALFTIQIKLPKEIWQLKTHLYKTTKNPSSKIQPWISHLKKTLIEHIHIDFPFETLLFPRDPNPTRFLTLPYTIHTQKHIFRDLSNKPFHVSRSERHIHTHTPTGAHTHVSRNRYTGSGLRDVSGLECAQFEPAKHIIRKTGNCGGYNAGCFARFPIFPTEP